MLRLKQCVVMILVLPRIAFGLPLVNDANSETYHFNLSELNDLEKFVDVINFYRLIRSESALVEDFSELHDHDSGEELQARGPNCGRCNRPKIYDTNILVTYDQTSRIPVGRVPGKPAASYKVNAGNSHTSSAHHHEKKRFHWAENVAASVEGGLYLALEDAVEYEGGIVVPVYDSAILKSKEYKKFKRTKDLLVWADKVEEKTEDPCVIYAICQLGLRPNDFGRLGDDLRRLIRKPTIYITDIIRRYATAINVRLEKINFGACKDEFQACLISSDKQHLVDIGFPVRGFFTTT